MAEISPVVIIKGTPNHDGTEQYTPLQEIIGSNPQITIMTTPQKTIIETNDGPIQVIGVPAIVHGNFRSKMQDYLLQKRTKASQMASWR